MNAGKIEQAGTPEDIYDRPRSEFVARFIGSSNVIKGKGLDASRVDFAGVRAALRRREDHRRRADGGLDPPARHQAFRRRSRQAENAMPATVTRQVFLGGSRDYMVEVKDGTQLRAVTAAGESIAQGSAVWLHLPPEKCRALMG